MKGFVVSVFSNGLLELLKALIVMLIGFIIKYVRQKTQIEIDNQKKLLIEQTAIKAVLATEEKAAKKAMKDGEKWDSNKKHAEAINMMLDSLQDISEKQACEMITFTIGKIKGIGSSKDVGVI